MIIPYLVKHHYKKIFRSPLLQKNIAINVILGFTALYFIILFLLLGFFIDAIIEQYLPDANVITVFNGFILYYLGLELVVRFSIQPTPAMNIAPYLHLPVRRSTLIHYLLIRNISNPLNYISFFIFIPFACKVLTDNYSATSILAWLLALLLLITAINYIASYIKRQLSGNSWIPLFCGLAFVAFFAADYFHIFSISEVSASAFYLLLSNPIWVLLIIPLLMGIYWVNFLFLRKNAYIEELDKTSKHEQVKSTNLNFTNWFGGAGKLMALEIKLMLRNKRTKGTLYLVFLAPLYGIWIYHSHSSSIVMRSFAGVFMTGFLSMCYGQFLIAWEGNYFDGILTRSIDFYQYFRAKYLLFVTAATVSFLFTVPFIYWGIEALLINICCYLFMVGVGSYIFLYFATYNRKKINLNAAGGAMNWQGMSAASYVVMLPILLAPMIIIGIVKVFAGSHWALISLAIPGIIGILLNKYLLKVCTKHFVEKKYDLAQAYRNSSD